MSIRTQALEWLESNYRVRGKGIYASKFYRAEESWPKTQVWWFEIPLDSIKETDSRPIHLLCEIYPGEDNFHYLKIPKSFFRENLRQLDVRSDNGKVSIYLSANPNHLFVEERGQGGINFKRFLISK